jgi:uncharacterized cupin superfamily protein
MLGQPPDQENAMPEAKPLRSPALDPMTVPPKSGSGYPEPYRAAVVAREWRPLGDPFGLKNFGVNLVRLKPGVASSQRHWHTHEDEFVYMLEGEADLVTDAGTQTLKPGMCAGFPAGKADGHHLINRSDRDAVFLCIGDRRDGVDICEYPDIDLHGHWVGDKWVYTHKNGEPW